MTGFGTAAGAKDIRTKSRSPGVAGFRKRTGDCPWAGRREWVIEVSGSDAPVTPSWDPHNRRSHSGLLLGLVHRFWTILDRILAAFIGLAENFFQGLDLGHPV
jgi:hypothetical protein